MPETGRLLRCISRPGRTSLIAVARGVGDDVDAPPGQLGRQAGVLALLADGQGQLVVRDHDPGGARGLVRDGDRIHARRRQGAGNEGCRVLAEVDDVDLFVVQFVHDGADAGAHFTDAGALGVDPRRVGLHGNLGAVPGFAGQRHDFHRMVGDFGYFEFEELTDQARVRAGQRHGRALGAAVHINDQGAEPVAVDVLFTGNLFGRRQERLQRSKVDLDHVRVVSLLDGAGYQFALTALEFAQDVVVLDVAEPLQDDLPCGACGDAAKAFGGVLEFTDGGAVVVNFDSPDGDVAALAVEFGARFFEGAGRLVIRHQERLLDGGDQEVQRDFTLTLQKSQCAHVNIHQASSEGPLCSGSRPSSGRWLNSISTFPLRILSKGSVTGSPCRGFMPFLTGTSGMSVTPPPSTAWMRPVTFSPWMTLTLTIRPRARCQCRGSVRGRPTPGEDTSRS